MTPAMHALPVSLTPAMHRKVEYLREYSKKSKSILGLSTGARIKLFEEKNQR
jgi:hypothetical protein